MAVFSVSFCVLILNIIIIFCRDWKFIHPKKKSHELENVNVGKIGLFSKEILYSLIVTNLLSFIIGTGVG